MVGPIGTLIPLRDIPHRARATEAAARRTFASREDAIRAAPWRIRNGVHLTQWCLTDEAAAALEEAQTWMPGGTYRRTYRVDRYVVD